jgi:hypothetical protein
LSSAFRFTRARTYSSDDCGERISILDDLNTLVVVPQRDLADIFTDIDTGRTGPLAGSCAVFSGVFVQNSGTDGGQPYDMLGTNPLTCPATGAFFRIDYGKAFGSHMKCIKLTGANTAAQPQASDFAYFHPTVKKHGGSAVQNAVVFIPGIRMLNTVGTSQP